MKRQWKRRVLNGELWYERYAFRARIFVRGRRVCGSYRWIVQHRALVYFGWSSSLSGALEEAEERAREIDLRWGPA